MLTPPQLTDTSFRDYPPLARRVAAEHIALFREMPIVFLALLLRELIAWDWKFPAERKELDRQFRFLNSVSQQQRQALFDPFAKLQLSPTLEAMDWVNEPATFSEQLSAHLWATHQIDSFHTAAREFFDKVAAAIPEEQPAIHRAAIVTFGQGVQKNTYPLFRKLRQHGTYFRRVAAQDGLNGVVDAAKRRAAAHREAFAHWYVSGASTQGAGEDLTCVSYESLKSIRGRIQQRMRQLYESGTGPEAIRSLLVRMRPQDLGMSEEDDALGRFKVSVLTEGSGTQVFSTSFVQWAAREALRRARPVTILVRFTPRQREKPMNELLTEAVARPEVDLQGSLIDADMGAYYTWLNQQRLTGADYATFLAWFENGSEAMAIGPKFKRGSVSDEAVALSEIVSQVV